MVRTSGILCLLLLFLHAWQPGGAPAAAPEPAPEGWQAVIAGHAHAPAFLLAVDKKEQLLSIFEHQGPFSKVAEYLCTTGQNAGDKLVRGDMKTPEGVYFVVSHIRSGLDYALYGNEAYPLNYPNPVDRLRRKTGSGIWLHGKGVPLIPYDSNGCVGMQNQDLATFESGRLIGRPIALALRVAHAPEAVEGKKDEAQALAARVEDWAKAWSDRSERLFGFYDPEAYSLAQGQSFSRFRAQKEALFKALPWIKTTVHDVQVLEGPGYWVTWFNQDYAAPNIRSVGTRRLYWQPDAQGEMRIVGMEWIKDFKSPLLYAEAGYRPSSPAAGLAQAGPVQAVPPERPAAPEAAPVQEFIGRWREAWQKQDMAAYMACYAENAVQDAHRGAAAIQAHKRRVWAGARILTLELGDMRLEPAGKGLFARMRQVYRDDRGYADLGEKTLYLEFNGNWRIAREEWAPAR